MYNPKLHFHFIGIGGSGMSGIAEVLLNLSFKVSGSDLKESSTLERLRSLGAQVFLGHTPGNIPEAASLVVYSSAINFSNPEVQEAKRRGIPIIPRAEVLAELMRLKYGVAVAGSHGKTTTTSLIAHVLDLGGLDPTVIIGGQVRSLGSGAKLGKGDFLVAETDESDRSFLILKPTLAVVTNIDAEHMPSYGSMADLEQAFEKFLSAVPFYGLAVLCVDDPRVRALAERHPGRRVTYGMSPDATIRAEELRPSQTGTQYTLVLNGQPSGKIQLPMLGRHMVQNSLAAVAIGLELGLELSTIIQALNTFSGVSRRTEILGQPRGVTVINDYGHHPAEVRATISAVRSAFDFKDHRLHVLFQPHRYTRTRDCFAEFMEAFTEADTLWLTEIYPASEEPIPGISGMILAEAISHPQAKFYPELNGILPALLPELQSGDVVLFLGAGSIGSLAESLVSELEK